MCQFPFKKKIKNVKIFCQSIPLVKQRSLNKIFTVQRNLVYFDMTSILSILQPREQQVLQLPQNNSYISTILKKKITVGNLCLL